MSIIIRQLGMQDYQTTLNAMRDFTEHRQADTADELWLLEHPPVYTQGLAGKEEHLLQKSEIPVIKTERGGQITYHGPGQLICYVMLNLKRQDFMIKKLVFILEQSIIDLLRSYHIEAERRENAPGVYIEQAKVAALGLRIRKGNTYHGLALNIDMDLTPYKNINPCGFPDLQVTQLSDQKVKKSMQEIGNDLVEVLCTHLNYTPQQRKIVDHF